MLKFGLNYSPLIIVFNMLPCISLTSMIFPLDQCIFLKNKFIYLFIFGCVGPSPLCTGSLQLRGAGATPRCGARAPHCSGLSLRGARALGARASAAVARGLSSCGTRAQ